MSFLKKKKKKPNSKADECSENSCFEQKRKSLRERMPVSAPRAKAEFFQVCQSGSWCLKQTQAREAIRNGCYLGIFMNQGVYVFGRG